MREVDRLATETYGIHLMQMMEQVGRSLAEVAREMVGGSARDTSVLVAAGRGNNGGGGLAAARHLANWGAQVTACLEYVDALAGVPAQQYRVARAAGVLMVEGERALAAVRPGGAILVVDALIGYGLHGAPRGWTAEMIDRIGASQIPVLSLDVPSGMDATTGHCADPCIRAQSTLTLALPKTGLRTAQGSAAAGRVYLADIGIPPALYAELGIRVPAIFARRSIVALTPEGDVEARDRS